MIPGATSVMPIVDRLIARWEVSRHASIPFMPTTVAILVTTVILVAIRATNAAQIALTAALLIGGAMVVALDVGRTLWLLRHPYASPRWLHAVHGAVGDDVAVHALAALMRRHDHEPEYIVKRSDMIVAVQIERECRREAKRRAEGVRLVELSALARPDPKVLADAERRRRARERRAARQPRTIA